MVSRRHHTIVRTVFDIKRYNAGLGFIRIGNLNGRMRVGAPNLKTVRSIDNRHLTKSQIDKSDRLLTVQV